MYLVIVQIPHGRTTIELREKRETALLYIRTIQDDEVSIGHEKPIGYLYRMGDYEVID